MEPTWGVDGEGVPVGGLDVEASVEVVPFDSAAGMNFAGLSFKSLSRKT